MTSVTKKILYVYLSISFIAGAFLCGLFVHFFIDKVSPESFRGSVLRQDDINNPFIDPLLAADIGTEATFPELGPAENKITSIINNHIAQNDADHVSVYFRLLKSARWFGINEKTAYAPASLLKVFVMMAYYSEADDKDDPMLLQKQVAFEGSKNPANDDPGEIIPHLVSGQKYTIDDVIKQMIIYSDNDALNTLVDNFDPDTTTALNEIFSELKIPSPSAQKENALNFMTVDEYSMIFRVLFGSTYLSHRYSEQALSLLSEAHYKNALVAGVPNNLVVSHKFGVADIPATQNNPEAKELHDCGIVYYPDHPYLLCVMTQGSDFAHLQSIIKEISSTTFDQVTTMFKK